MEFAFALGVGINVFTLFLLIKNRSRKEHSNDIAIALVTLWLLRFLFFYIKTQDFALNYPVLFTFDQYLFLLDGVLLWLYTKSLLEAIQFSLRIGLHFIPFLFGLLLTLLQVTLNPQDLLIQEYQAKLEAYGNNTLSISLAELIFIFLIMLLSLIYFLKSLQQIRQYNQVLFANFSNLKNLSASWLVNFLRLWMLFFLLPVLIYFFNYLYPIIDMQFSGYVLFSLLLLFSLIFNLNIVNQNYLPPALYPKSPEKVQALPEKELNNQLQKLESVLREEKYYQDENLSLQKLSAYLDMKPVELTELIKNSEFKNFYDLINSYRIEAIKAELLASREQIMIIAYNQGFNSKSAFNRIFKENTGQTPSEYRRSQK